ncbi:MAG: ATP-binding protein [bacterium]
MNSKKSPLRKIRQGVIQGIDSLHMQEFSLRIIAWLTRQADLPVLGQFIRFCGNLYCRSIIYGQTHSGFSSSRHHQHTVIDHDSAMALIQKEKDLCLIDCVCRKIGRNCNAPLKTCILVGTGARVRNKANPDRKITVEQATHILQSCFDQNLIHNAIYALGDLVEICNCCQCCCVPILGVRQGIQSLRPSHYVAVKVNSCSMCGVCETVCPFGAIEQGNIDNEKCFGCGLCAYKCPEEAVTMVERRYC